MLNQIIFMRIIQFYFLFSPNRTAQFVNYDNCLFLAIGSLFNCGTHTTNRILRVANNFNISFIRLFHTIGRLFWKSTCFSCVFCKFNATDIHRSRRICTRHFCFVAKSFFHFFLLAVAVCRCYNWFYEETFH